MRVQHVLQPLTCANNLLRTICALVAFIAASACQPDGSARQMDRAAAMAIAQQFHDELNRLEIAGQIDAQTKYFAENVMRLDPHRIPSQGRAAFIAYARAAHASGYRPVAATTTVLDAWVEGGHMVEYGTTILRASFDGGAVVDDPVNYLAVWRFNLADPLNAQIETIIWNTQRPVAALSKLGTFNP